MREFSDREDDIDNEIFNIIRGTKYEKLYMEGIQERIEDGISESETHTIDQCSPHELEFIKTSPGLINKLSDYTVYSLLDQSQNKDEMARILGPENINKLNSDNVYKILDYSQNKDEMARILGPENINKLSNNNVYYLLHSSLNKEEMAKILGSENINKLSDNTVYYLLYYSLNKEEMAKILMNYLSSDRIEQFKLKFPQQAKWFNASPTPIRERHSNYKSYYS